MPLAVLLGTCVSYRDAVAAQVRTPWELVTLPDSTAIDSLNAHLAPATTFVTARLTKEMRLGPGIGLIQVGGAGLDAIDMAALPDGMWLCNAFGHEAGMGEYALMAMLAWQHRLIEAATGFKAGSWRFSGHIGDPPHGEVAGKAVGVLGLGKIGRAVATRAHALGMTVTACNRSPMEKPTYIEKLHGLDQLHAFLADLDFVVVACALTEATRSLIDAEALAAMRPTAVLINLARGPLCDEAALFAALKDGRIAGAVLDTWYRYPSAADPAPRPANLPFHELANVIMTPHSSGWTEGLFHRRGGQIAQNLDSLVNGAPFINVVREGSPRG